MKTFILWTTILGSLWCLSLARSQSHVKTASKSEYSIIFNGWYHSGKQKWQGPYHNKLLFPWFTANISAINQDEYKKLINEQFRNGVKFIGYYYSATTSYPSNPVGNNTRFPERSIPPESIKYSWILRDGKGRPITWDNQENRYFLDVGIKEVRDAVLISAIRNAKQLRANVLYLDNWTYKYWAPGDLKEQQWTEKCLSLLIRAREFTRQNDIKLVVNLSSPPEYWPEFAPHLDGIAYEMPAHPYRLKMQESHELELRNYEKVMGMGKTIFLYTDILTDNGKRWDEDGRKVAATAMLVVPEAQPYWGGIYVCPPRYEVWPVGGWPIWPEQLGKPLEPRKWDGNTVTRKFAHGTISVTVGQNPKFNISFEY